MVVWKCVIDVKVLSIVIFDIGKDIIVVWIIWINGGIWCWDIWNMIGGIRVYFYYVIMVIIGFIDIIVDS